MASAPITRNHSRVSPIAASLLSIATTVDSYWSRKAFGDSYHELAMSMGQDERDALGLINRGLFRLFPFDPDQDAGPRRGV